jgi:polygalacturonase
VSLVWRRGVFVLAALVRGAFAADVSPAQPVIPDRTFNLRDFGAMADATTSNTEAFQHAVAAVHEAGGGTLIVPGGIYLTDPFELCSGINLHLDPGATIRFAPHAMPPESGGRSGAQLTVRNAHDVMISGAGTMNGSGDAWWVDSWKGRKIHGYQMAPRPRMINFEACQRVRVEGITLTHSPAWCLNINRSQDVTVDGVTIYNPTDDNPKTDGVDPAVVRAQLQKLYGDEAPNTDGIDPKSDQRVLIAHCRIDTGDDCIALGGGQGIVEEDVLITDCAFLHGHGCSVGSGTTGGVRNLTVRRCTFDGTEVGAHLKSARDRGGLVENVMFSDLVMKNVGEALVFTSYYEATDLSIFFRPYLKPASIDLFNGGHDLAQPVTATTPQWRNLTVRNITASCLWDAGFILGLPEMPVENIVLEHVHIQAPDGLRLNYAKDVVLRDVHIVPERGPPLIVSDTVAGLTQ